MIRIASWNIWWRFGPWEQRAAGIEHTLRSVDADIVCLQETWAVDGRNQAHELGDALGAHVAVGPDGSEGHRLGNAILSRWPITCTTVSPLPLASGTDGHRTLVRARIDTPHGLVDAYSTHLAYRFDESGLRAAQLARVCETIVADRADPDISFPPILCGDLNATPDSDELRAITGRRTPPVPELVFTDAWDAVGRGPGWTWDNRNPHLRDTTWPQRRLDYVLIGWPRDKPIGNPTRARLAGGRRHHGVWPSDHLAVVVDLETEARDA